MENNEIEKVSTYTADLAELKEIENVITSQLDELGQKIDSSFAKAAELVSKITDVAYSISSGRWSEKTRNSILLVGSVASSAIQGIGDAYNAYQYNKSLDKLLVQKQAIATAKKAAIAKVLPKLEHFYKNYSKILAGFTSKDYDLKQMHNESYAKLVYSRFDKNLDMLRAVIYNHQMANIMAEYNAWLGGEQQSELLLPTYWDANKEIAELLGNPDPFDMPRYYAIGAIDSRRHNGETIPGNDLCFLHDEQLMSQFMSENTDKMLGRTWPTEEEIEEDLKNTLGDDINDEELREATLKDILSNYPIEDKPMGLPGTLFALHHFNSILLPRPDFFDEFVEAEREYDETYNKMKKDNIILHINTFVLLMLDYLFLIDGDGLIGNWASWLRWVVGIIVAIAVLFLWEGWYIPLRNKSKHEKMTELADDVDNTYKTAAGYQYIEKKILKKKNVVGSFLNGVFR